MKWPSMMRPARRSDPPNPWDPYDIVASLRSPCRNLPVSIEDEVASLIRRVDAMLSAQTRPADDDTLFYLVSDGRGRLLTIRSTADESALLGFTTLRRAAHFAGMMKWRKPQPVSVSLRGLSRVAGALAQPGVTTFALNMCPYCDVCDVIPVASLESGQKVLNYWATRIVVRMSQFERYLAEAQHQLAESNIDDAESLGQNIVTHIDAERPEVHLLLGQCAKQRHDENAVNRKKEILRLFGADWVSKLE